MTSLNKPQQFGNELPNGATAMAKHGFNCDPYVPESTVVFDNFEQRIVTKTTVAGWLEGDSAVTGGFTVNAHAASWVG